MEFLEARRLILMRRGSRIEKTVTDAAIFDEVPKDSDLSDLRVGLSDLFEYFRGTIKAAPRPADAWRPIMDAIDRGQHPKPDEISAALCCPEPTIHADIRNYIARLLRGEIDRRGRPKKGNVKPKKEFVERSMNFFEGNDVYQYFEASYLKRRVDRWHRVFRDRKHLSEPQNRAFEKVATEYGWRGGAAAARTRYYEAKEVLTTFALTVKIPDRQLRAMLGRHHVTARSPK